jgi:hypothetical protein
MDELVAFVGSFPQGVAPGEIEHRFNMSRTTLNRRLRQAITHGLLSVVGKGPSTRYLSSDPLAALRAYFEKPHTERVVAPYREAFLETEPHLQKTTVEQLSSQSGHALDKRGLSRFLIDFSCASSVLEGGTYSLLDTQALLEYGEKSKGKPLEDAFLVLNHREAFEYLYDHPTLESIYHVHAALTNDHELPELAGSRHFLDKAFRGIPREFTDVDIALSAYLPPFRPGTKYIVEMLARVLDRATEIDNPVQAAFYLLTRLPYLQPFQDGNKRVSRAMCNVPLLQAGLPPISFVDFGKRDYIVSLLAFYELGDTRLAESCFLDAYQKSIRRLRARK